MRNRKIKINFSLCVEWQNSAHSILNLRNGFAVNKKWNGKVIKENGINLIIESLKMCKKRLSFWVLCHSHYSAFLLKTNTHTRQKKGA